MCGLKLDRDGRNLNTEYLSINRQSRLRGRGGERESWEVELGKRGGRIKKDGNWKHHLDKHNKHWALYANTNHFKNIMEMQPMNKTCTNPEN